MIFRQKALGAVLCISLIALLGNSVLANQNDNMASNSKCNHSWSKKDGHAVNFDKRMSALKTTLQLTPDQETSWNEYVSKMKPVKMESTDSKNWKDLSTPDRLDRKLEHMKFHEKQMAERAVAVRTFYDTLNQEQKEEFDNHYQRRNHHLKP